MSHLLERIREKAGRQAQEAELPGPLNEDWRFGKPGVHASEWEAALAHGPTGGLRVEVHAPKVEGLRILPLAEAPFEELSPVRSIGSDRLLAMHQMHAGEGVCIILDPGVELHEAIAVTYATAGLAMPTTLILAGEGSRADVIEKHRCEGDGKIFGLQKVDLSPRARLSYQLEQQGSGRSQAFEIADYTVRSGARLRQLTQHARAAWARQETTLDMLGEGSRAELFSANALEGAQFLDQRTRQIHSVRDAYSNLLYKNVVDGKATAVFAGMILVQPGAHGSDAYQSNRNMATSETALVHSLPGLEILADGVRCSHGSATGPMDEEELFYLLSRGIPRYESQKLVAQGFLQDAVDRFHAEATV